MYLGPHGQLWSMITYFKKCHTWTEHFCLLEMQSAQGGVHKFYVVRSQLFELLL